MYTLSKAKEEIDTVAKHATDIAAHVMRMSDDMNAKLESFKTEILSIIEEKFNELGRKLHGDAETVETTAVSDLGAKVSLLTGAVSAPPAAGTASPEPGPRPHHDEAQHDPQPQHGEPQNHDPQPQHDDHRWNQGQQPEGHQSDTHQY